MTLCNPQNELERAQREQYAVGAFNANTLEQIQAIVFAAQAENAPAIIQVSHRALQYLGSGNEMLGLEYVAALGKIAANSVSVPIALHLDHANEDEVRRAIALGFTSVMFDGSLLPITENIETTRRLSSEVTAAGVCLEAEVGKVPKPGVSDDSEELTVPTEAAAFVAATQVNSLAVALGSAHGMAEKRISLDLERLSAIRDLVSVPLVLHGSSGVKDDEIAKGISRGLCKVNVATQMNKAFTAAVVTALQDDTKMTDPRKFLGPARAAMIEAVREYIRFFGSSGKAVSRFYNTRDCCPSQPESKDLFAPLLTRIASFVQVQRQVYEADFLRLVTLLEVRPEQLDETIPLAAQFNSIIAEEKDFDTQRAKAVAICQRRIQAAVDLYRDRLPEPRRVPTLY